jgi:dipeptidyl aminopeptidase/acylaminoacyl peptidase
MILNGPNLQEHDPRALLTARRTQSLFRKAIPFLECEVKILNIPYVDERLRSNREIFLPAYLYIPALIHRLKDTAVPVLINTPGADSVQEELYFTHPQGGHQRGYAVLTFEGPGQGMPLKETGAYMRPDWEIVTSKVVDFLEDYAEILEKEEGICLDMQRIAVTGASMGGYLALRAASDPRVKACVSVDPFYDMWEFCTKHLSGMFMGAWLKG